MVAEFGAKFGDVWMGELGWRPLFEAFVCQWEK